MKKIDYLIVGQGIAGTLLAWFLDQAGQSFIIIDDGHQRSSTKIAAGLINPITGRRFVKSWMIDELLPFAKTTYQAIEQQAKLEVWKEVDIIRYFQTTAEGNNWLSKTSYEGYGQFLSSEGLKEDLSRIINDTGGYGIVKGAKVAVKKIIEYFQKAYKEKNQLIAQKFDYTGLKVEEDSIQYQDIQAKKVLFCEGYAAKDNPWFSHLPYESAKGEVLVLKIPFLKTQYIIKKNQFLIPLSDNYFWFGSNYEWDDLTNKPSLAGRNYLEERLKEIIQVEYEVVDHLAAVRPVLKDRRPALGLHPTYSSIGILNGMGTKGTSIAPYWADQFVRHLVEGVPLSPEILVSRFF